MDILGFVPVFLSWAVGMYLTANGMILGARNLQLFSETYILKLTAAAEKFRIFFTLLSTGSLSVAWFLGFGENGIFDYFIMIGWCSPVLAPAWWVIYIYFKAMRNGR